MKNQLLKSKSWDSVGIQTTRSVVISICLIIVVDALFAILFKAMGV
jgi:ABC-type transporter Mla maintaining outer membrane lipid asymmetry permease subunit MlaE